MPGEHFRQRELQEHKSGGLKGRETLREGKKGEEGKRRESCSCGGEAGQAESWEADRKGSREVLEGAAACSGAQFLREGR